MSDFPKMFSAHFVADIGQIRDKLTSELVRTNQSSRLAAIVFANGSKGFVRSEIVPLVEYWNYRSKDYVTFFFVGYVGDDSAEDSEFVRASLHPDAFDEKSFVEAIESFEQESTWKYRGDTPLILCRAFLRYHKTTGEPKAFLDLSSIIEFELEHALREKAIHSVDSFFELVILVAKETPGGSLEWKLSDKLGARALGDALVEAILGKLPRGTKHLVDAIRFFRVQGGN